MLERYLTLSDICQYDKSNIFGTTTNAKGDFSQEGVDFEVLTYRGVLPPAPNHLDEFYQKDKGITLLIEDMEVYSSQDFEIEPSVVPLLANVDKIVVSIPYESDRAYRGTKMEVGRTIIEIFKSVALLRMDCRGSFSLIFDNIFMSNLYIDLAVQVLLSYISTGVQLDKLLISIPILIAIRQKSPSAWEGFVEYLENNVYNFILVEAFAPTDTFKSYTPNSTEMYEIVKDLTEFFENTKCLITLEKIPPCINWPKQTSNNSGGYIEIKYAYYSIKVPMDLTLIEFLTQYINYYKRTGETYTKELLDTYNSNRYITIVAPQKTLEMAAKSPYIINHAEFFIQRYDKECKKDEDIIQNQIDLLMESTLLPTETKLTSIRNILERVPTLLIYYLYIQSIEYGNVTFVGENGETDGTYLGENVAAVMQVGFLKYKEYKGEGLVTSNYNFFY